MRSVLVAAFLAMASVANGQSTGAGSATEAGQGTPSDIKNYAPVLSAFGQLLQHLKENVQLPPERTQSQLLPLLPDSTVFYIGLPNYGEASHQALTLFHQELAQDSELKKFWEHGAIAAQAPKIEEYMEKFYELSQYLGDEIVLSAAVGEGRKEPAVLLLAKTRKPGAKSLLEQWTKEISKSPAVVRVFDPEELSTTKTAEREEKLTILVRPDFLLGSLNLETLRWFNAELDRKGSGFVTTQFGRRIEQAYEGGATAVGAIDLQRILTLVPKGADASPTTLLQRTGFGEMRYLVWRHKTVSGRASSEAELTFTGARHGVASWLASPGTLGGLDFVSPGAVMVVSARLKKPAEMFDDIKDLATASNPNAMAALPQMEQALHMSLRDDLLSQLAGEFTVELESASPSTPQWRTIFRINNPERLQAALSKVLAIQHIGMQQVEQDGIIYYDIQVPSPQKATEFSYAFLDGYLILGSSQAAVTEAIRLHHSGGSLAKSPKFLESLPPAPLSEVSALVYEDASALMAFQLRQASRELASLMPQGSNEKGSGEKNTVVMCAYGDESALREASVNQSVDVSAVLVMAAIAIPNLMRARNAAHDSSAVASIRTVNTAQATYSATYPERGFARDLASLGPDPNGVNKASAAHAGIIDQSLGNSECTAGKWCTKSGFQFTIKALCVAQQCTEYAALATPVDPNSGTRSFCSTSDGVIRMKFGPPLTAPISAAECRKWTRLPQ